MSTRNPTLNMTSGAPLLLILRFCLPILLLPAYFTVMKKVRKKLQAHG